MRVSRKRKALIASLFLLAAASLVAGLLSPWLALSVPLYVLAAVSPI